VKPGRLPSDVYWLLLWLALWTVLCLESAQRAGGPFDRGLLLGLGVLLPAAAIGIWRLRPWARLLGGALLVVMCLRGVAATARDGITLWNVCRVLFHGWWAWYLFSPSTSRLFRESRGSSVSATGCLAPAAPIVLILLWLPAAQALKLPSWAGVLGFVGVRPPAGGGRRAAAGRLRRVVHAAGGRPRVDRARVRDGRHHLTGLRYRIIRARARFDADWERERPRHETFDSAMAAGLHAAAAGAWEEAERQFATAAEAWPERACARYNRARALLELDRFADAEPLLEKLAKSEPDEAFWWTRLGDCRRLLDNRAGAIEAYRTAIQKGGLEAELAMRFGVMMAEEGSDAEAKRAFDAALGPEPDAETLERLGAFLESAGAWRLAAGYREEAFRRSLGDKHEEEEEDEDGDGESAAGRL